MNPPMNASAFDIISNSNYKLTRARQAILKALPKLKGPFTAHDLLAKIEQKSGKDKVDLATIYRNLPVFEELGLICKSDFSDEVSRYMVSDPGHDHHHHHIICRECDRIEPIDFCIVKAQEQILGQMGFKDIRHRLEFTGLCRACS